MAAFVGLATTFATPVGAADPIADKRAEARRIANERAKLTSEAERLNEDAKRAADELAALEQTIADTERRLDGQREVSDAIRRRAAELALNTYVRGDVAGGLGAALADEGAMALQLHRGYAPVALGGSTDALDTARAAEQDTESLAATLVAQQRQKERLRATLAARQRAVAQTQTKLEATARRIDAQLVTLVAEEQARVAAEAEAAAAAREQARLAEEARKAAAERAARLAAQTTVATTAAPTTAAPRATAAPTTAAAAATTPAANAPGAARPAATTSAPRATAAPTTRAPRATSPPTTAPPAPIEIPPTSPAAAVAVAAALSQLGKPYVFGANGPDTFDCSGLTQWAWARAGVAMPHYTGSQFAAFPQVPANQLQPGDLVFFNIALGHVGMYIGNGQYVHAPRTGDVVKVSPLVGRRIVAAVRPG